MKIILTESQLNEIIAREKIITYLEESCVLSEGHLRDDIKWSIRNALIAGVSSAAILAALGASGKLAPPEKQAIRSYVETLENQIQEPSNNSTHIYAKELHDLKVSELGRCMQEKYLKLKGHKAYNAADIVLSAEKLVDECEAANYNLVLAAAQAWNESAWGTTPRAKKTNSVFSVGAYDNGKDVVSYKDQNASVRPYINLMQNDYNMNADTLSDIFAGKKQLVNHLGNRYASDTNYEKNLKLTYNAILRTYPILSWDLETYIAHRDEVVNK